MVLVCDETSIGGKLVEEVVEIVPILINTHSTDTVVASWEKKEKMKGGGGWGGGGGGLGLGLKSQRRWRGLVIGVLGLVILSMLVPLAFLLGLHNGFRPAPPGTFYFAFAFALLNLTSSSSFLFRSVSSSS